MKNETKTLLEAVRDGQCSVEEALLEIKSAPFADLGFAKVDLHRKLRQGASEVIYGEGKTAAQIVEIAKALINHGQNRVLITRIDGDKAERIQTRLPLVYHPEGRLGTIGDFPKSDGLGRILVVSAGTSDLPIAEEAALTAEFFGNEVIRLNDVGVAGLHRLLAHQREIMTASVIIAVAGMEGALASVVGGLAECPVIAVPTGVGYGAAFGGLSALLSMLNSCAAGVTVVNIDNGFGAGFAASRINHMEAKK